MDFLDFDTFFFQLPIYTRIVIDDTNFEKFVNLVSGSYQKEPTVFNGYNPFRKSESSFISYRFAGHYLGVEQLIAEGGIVDLVIKCKRWDDEMHFFIRYDSEKQILMKIGQYPSVADFHIHEVKQYDRILSKDKLREFTRAIGLAANGVGIGSFVYLRRIFEELIEEAHSAARADQGWSEEEFSKARMVDKIQLLSAHLPSFLVEHKSLYGILSKGVHALAENECLTHFDTVRVGIELILDEKLEIFNQKEKLKQASQKLAALSQQLKGNSDKQ